MDDPSISMMLVHVISQSTSLHINKPYPNIIHPSIQVFKMTPSIDLDSPIDNSEHDGFLDIVAACPTIEKCPYNNRQEIVHRRQAGINEGESEWILLTDIDDQTFAHDFLLDLEFDMDDDDDDQHHHENQHNNYKQSEIPLSWSSFDANLNLLFVRMPILKPHEVAAQTFNELFLDAVAPTGLKYELDFTGSMTCYGEKGRKQAEYSYLPYRVPRGRSRGWPSVVLEIAFSENGSKLMSDVRFWLNRSHGNVKIALTLRVDRQIPLVTIEAWEANEKGRLHRTQRVTIERTGTDTIKVSGPLAIGFEKLFLRKADIPRETDMVMDSGKLETLGRIVWRNHKV